MATRITQIKVKRDDGTFPDTGIPIGALAKNVTMDSSPISGISNLEQIIGNIEIGAVNADESIAEQVDNSISAIIKNELQTKDSTPIQGSSKIVTSGGVYDVCLTETTEEEVEALFATS